MRHRGREAQGHQAALLTGAIDADSLPLNDRPGAVHILHSRAKFKTVAFEMKQVLIFFIELIVVNKAHKKFLIHGTQLWTNFFVLIKLFAREHCRFKKRYMGGP